MSDIEYANIDHLFALHTLKRPDHPLYTFCLDLMKASRDGHLFIERKEVDPSIEEILKLRGSSIMREGTNYYLKRNFYHEEEIAKRLSKRASLPKLNLEIKAPAHLNEKQQNAFDLLNTSPFFLITGGPGSGKSFVAKAMIKAYSEKYPNKKIICSAPTGKALSALSQTGETSLTLHKLLEIREGFNMRDKDPFIICDLLIIDECSMISPKLFNLLLSALLDMTQVIFIGDPNQLPPVSGASIFYDFTKLDILSNITLTAPMRSDKQAIIDFASAIIDEDEGALRRILENKNEITMEPIECMNFKNPKKNHILLTPFRKGPFGSLKLNEMIKPAKDHPIPILITKNDSITTLTNGDIGFIKEEVATFAEKDISLPILMLPPHEKAFALSIHKSQGSEFDHVSIILPEEAICFPKELLFTAITRAKKSIHIYGSFETLLTLIKNRKRVSSNLKKKIESLETIVK